MRETETSSVQLRCYADSEGVTNSHMDIVRNGERSRTPNRVMFAVVYFSLFRETVRTGGSYWLVREQRQKERKS